MRPAALVGRFCLNCAGGPRLFRLAPRPRYFFPRLQQWSRRAYWKGTGSRAPVVGTVLLAALSPGSFLELAEKTDGGETTGEMEMLKASRQELQKTVAGDVRGLSRLCQIIYVLSYKYIYEPIATGLRFFHLVIIFIPVLATVPVIWFGERTQSRNGERTGTLWWYKFLVRSMERAGPAFIKVRMGFSLFPWISKLTVYKLLISRTARTMGSFANRHISSYTVQYNVLPPLERSCTSVGGDQGDNKQGFQWAAVRRYI